MTTRLVRIVLRFIRGLVFRGIWALWLMWALYWFAHPILIGGHSLPDSLFIYDGLVNLSSVIVAGILFLGMPRVYRILKNRFWPSRKPPAYWKLTSQHTSTRPKRELTKTGKRKHVKTGKPRGRPKAPKKTDVEDSGPVDKKAESWKVPFFQPPKAKLRIPGLLFLKRLIAFILIIFYIATGQFSLTGPQSLPFSAIFWATALLLLDYLWKTRRKARAREREGLE